jgi:hypothetical protein
MSATVAQGAQASVVNVFVDTRQQPPQTWITKPPIAELGADAGAFCQALQAQWTKIMDGLPDGNAQKAHLQRSLQILATVRGGGDRQIYWLKGTNESCAAVMEISGNNIEALATTGEYKNVGAIMVEYLLNLIGGAEPVVTLNAFYNEAMAAYAAMGFDRDSLQGRTMTLTPADEPGKWERVGGKWRYKSTHAAVNNSACCTIM